jgi:hypothetical protein
MYQVLVPGTKYVRQGIIYLVAIGHQVSGIVNPFSGIMNWSPGIRCQVPGIKYKVPGIIYPVARNWSPVSGIGNQYQELVNSIRDWSPVSRIGHQVLGIRYRVPGVNCQVWGIRCQVSSTSTQVLGTSYVQVLWIRTQVSSCKLQRPIAKFQASSDRVEGWRVLTLPRGAQWCKISRRWKGAKFHPSAAASCQLSFILPKLPLPLYLLQWTLIKGEGSVYLTSLY